MIEKFALMGTNNSAEANAFVMLYAVFTVVILSPVAAGGFTVANVVSEAKGLGFGGRVLIGAVMPVLLYIALTGGLFLLGMIQFALPAPPSPFRTANGIMPSSPGTPMRLPPARAASLSKLASGLALMWWKNLKISIVALPGTTLGSFYLLGFGRD